MTFSRTTGRTSHMEANPCTLYPASSQAKQIFREGFMPHLRDIASLVVFVSIAMERRQEDCLAVQRSLSLRPSANVGPIRSHHTGFYVVGEIDSKDFVSQIPNILAVFDGKQDLNSSIEIARHEISTPSINLFLIIVPEVVYAAVLQESAHHTYDANVLADTGYIRAQTADAPHQEVHFHSRLGSTIEKPDHLAVNQRVHFEDKVAPAMPTVTCNFAFN